MTNSQILLDLYKRYTRTHLKKIFLSIFFSILVAGSTAMIAYLLDPAIENIFIEKNQKQIRATPSPASPRLALPCLQPSTFLFEGLMGGQKATKS